MEATSSFHSHPPLSAYCIIKKSLFPHSTTAKQAFLHPLPPIFITQNNLPSSPLLSSSRRPLQGHPSIPPKPPIPPSQKGILPLPDEGWIKVVNKKKLRRSNLHSVWKIHPPPTKPKRCILCGDRSHMARSFNLGDFKCFACNSIGHTSVSCPNKKCLLLPSIITPSSEPTPVFVPLITIPESLIENMEAFSCFDFFTLQVENPTFEELIANLEFHLKVDRWIYDIRPTSPYSYFFQFPNEETIDLACSTDFAFGGIFVPWSEKLSVGCKKIIEDSQYPRNTIDEGYKLTTFTTTKENQSRMSPEYKDYKLTILVKRDYKN